MKKIVLLIGLIVISLKSFGYASETGINKMFQALGHFDPVKEDNLKECQEMYNGTVYRTKYFVHRLRSEAKYNEEEIRTIFTNQIIREFYKCKTIDRSSECFFMAHMMLQIILDNEEEIFAPSATTEI